MNENWKWHKSNLAQESGEHQRKVVAQLRWALIARDSTSSENIRSLLDICLKFILSQSCDYRDRWQCPIIWSGKNTAQNHFLNDHFKNNTKSGKVFQTPRTFADDKRKALSFLWLFALQLTYMLSCINKNTTETRSSPGFLLSDSLILFKETGSGNTHKTNFLIEVLRSSLPFTHPQKPVWFFPTALDWNVVVMSHHFTVGIVWRQYLTTVTWWTALLLY